MRRYLAIIAIVFALIATLVFAQNQTAQTPIPAPQDSELKAVWFPFNGAWLPDQDPSLIGPKNYRTLKNLRYNDTALEGVNGYSKINTTGTTPYTDIRNGIQLTSDRTTRSYVIVQAQTDAGLGEILYNTTAVPSQGDFSGTTLHSDTTGFDLPRFSQAPNGNIAYSNSKESMIWAGDEMRVSGLFLCSGVSTNLTNPVDYTEAVNDTLQTSGHYFTVSSGTSSFLVFSTRPLSGVKFYVKTASVSATGLTAGYWSGTTFTAVSNPVDGTKSGVTSFAQTGTFTFDSTVSTAKPYYFQGLYLYAYAFNLAYGSADIYHISAKAPFQNIVDVWDGVYRQPITFQFGYNDTGTNINYEDYTLEVNEASYPTVPIGAVLDGMRVQDHAIIMFDDRMAGIKWDMLAGYANTAVSGATLDYWSGTTWVTVSNFTDGTKSGTSTLVQTGVMTWTPPSGASEFKQTLFGQTGYAYRFRLASGNLSGTHGDATEELYVDQVTGIPAQLEVKPFKFPSMYKNRLLLAGYAEGKEGNRVDYSASNAPDVWNGEDSSKDGLQSLFFGGSEPLTAGSQLYNRVGSNIFATWVAFKETEMYLLVGDNKEDFKIYPVSFEIGCPAPLTVATASMNIAEGADVNVIMWLSNRGPMMFDLTTPKLIRGVDKYFDPVNAECINSAYIKNARGWYDPNYREYNLLIPSGSTATTNNVWLVYDLIRKKWYQKDTGTAEMPQCAFQVMDTNGKKYVYGGIDTGYMVRLENSYRWDTTAITQTVETGDFFPSENPWEITRIRRVKLASKVTSEDCDVTVTHYNNTSDSSGVTVALVALDSGTSERVTRDTQPFNLDAWSHRFKFSTTTTTTLRGFSPILWGMEYLLQRRDHITINPYTEAPTIHQVSDSRSLYYVNYASADQGVDDNDSSLRDLVESVIGPSRRATVVFKHWRLSGTADTTYTMSTAFDMSAYKDIDFVFEKGAILSIASGVTLTFPTWDNVKTSPRQQIFKGLGWAVSSKGGTASAYWHGALSDGSTDDYAALQKSLTGMVGGGVLEFPKGTSFYAVSSTLISGNTNTKLLFEKGAEIKVSGVSTTLLRLQAPYNTVEGGNFTGYGSYQTSGTGGASLISAVSDYATIRDCYFKEPEQQAIYVSGDYATLENNLIEGGKYFAAYADMGSDRQHYGINIAADADYGKALVNTIKPNGNTNAGKQIQGIVASSTSVGWEVIGNTIGDCYDHGLYLGLQGSTISDNVLTGCGIKVQMPTPGTATKGNAITGNTVDVNDTTALGDSGIVLTNAQWTTASNNTIRRATDYGISLTASTTPYMITDNIISNNIIDYVRDGASINSLGIAVDQSSVTKFANNKILNNTISNIGADGATVLGDQFGIMINVASGTSDHIMNVISLNTIDTVQEGGIYVLELTDSEISNNFIRNVGTGGTPYAAIEVLGFNRSRVKENYVIGGVSTSYGYREDTPGQYNEVKDNTFINCATAPIRHLGIGSGLITGTQIGTSGVTRYGVNADRTIGQVELFNHTHIRDPNGANRTDTFPTAAQIAQNVVVGDGNKLNLHYINSGDTETITLAFGSGVTVMNSGGGNSIVLQPYHAAKLTFINDSGTTIFVLGTVY